MPNHWTFDDFQATVDLMQGDIVRPDDNIRNVLELTHKHFSDPKYSAFMVFTQSCDLVRGRKGERCKSRYINFAAIRPRENVLLSLLNSECDKVNIPGKNLTRAYYSESRQKADNLLSRILNQNETGLGYSIYMAMKMQELLYLQWQLFK